MQRGNIYFSVGEEEVIENLKRSFGITELEAIEEVIKQKRQLAYIWEKRGNKELAEQLRKEIGDIK